MTAVTNNQNSGRSAVLALFFQGTGSVSAHQWLFVAVSAIGLLLGNPARAMTLDQYFAQGATGSDGTASVTGMIGAFGGNLFMLSSSTHQLLHIVSNDTATTNYFLSSCALPQAEFAAYTSPCQATVTGDALGKTGIAATSLAVVGAASTITPRSGTWWTPTVTGRGWVVDTNSDGDILLTGFATAGDHPVWVNASGAYANNIFTGPLQTCRSGPTLSSTANAIPGDCTPVGTISVVFASSTLGQVTMPDGVQYLITPFSSY
ncbi:MAG: hypothetical protein P4M00_06950 [Azospirillaceae bacterium]|nr:hypothetical protein [Azospirillaceae bacterium]